MKIINLLAVLSLLFVGSSFSASAQNQPSGIKPSLVTGAVVSVDAEKIVLNTKEGPLTAIISDKTEYKRVPADNPSLKAAVAAAFADIGVGDRVVVSGIFSSDKTKLPVRSVYLMTKSEIAQRQAKENAKWRTRGITGRVVSVSPQTKQITVQVTGISGSSTVALTPKENAKFLRYAPDSVKFEEAKTSTIGEVTAGDMLRAVGDRSADGTSFVAEEVITGAFQTLAGTVKAVDPAKGEVVITHLQTKKDVTVAISPTSLLKRFPQEMAERMAGMQGGGVRPPGASGAPPAGAQPGQAGGAGRGGFGARGAGGIDELLERFPTITAADLKAGDMIAVSSTRTGSADRITAIKLLAGIEAFIRAAEANNGRQTGAQRGQGDFNIPGLEGFGNP